MLDYSAVSRWLQHRTRPLLLAHVRPDGDALGSLAGMALALRALKQAPQVCLFDPFPGRYRTLQQLIDWQDWGAAAAQRPTCDSVIVLDTCAFQQLEPAAEFLRQAPPTLVIDHHVTRDEIGVRSQDLRCIDPSASATALLVHEWVAGVPLAADPARATALFTGIVTDTGWLRFSNTDGRTLRAAAELIEAGVRPNDVYAELYQQDAPARLRLIGRALANLQMHAAGRLAVLTVRQADFAAAGADASMTEDLVNEATRLGDTEATLLFNETPDGVIRVNFRSKRRLDVAALARVFGGGGHERAAGARVSGPWEAATAKVINATVAALQQAMAD